VRLLVLCVSCCAALYGQGAGGVQFRDWNAPSASAKAKIACGELRSLTGFDLSVISATLIPAAGEVPEHCRVSILVQPEVGVEVNLPSAWNGRLYMFGNGGWAGESFESAGRVAHRGRALKYGFATAATDTGHSAASEPGATFALNRQKLIDFAFRSLHVTAESAKLMIRNYYGETPSKSYYDGCSQGGREGLMLAQRFPADFDGILVGAPVLDEVGTMLARAWREQGLAANPLPALKLKLLAERVYAKCDVKDGLKDGLIGDPLHCGFQPTRDLPHCAEGADAGDCFTTGELSSLDRIYGDVVSQGKRIFPGWPVGAEVVGPNGQSAWLGMAVNRPNGPGSWTSFGEAFLRYVAFPKRDVPNAIASFDLDRDLPQMDALRPMLDATDPDLSAFEKRGGKLVMYFGWADPQLNPRMGVEYFENVSQRMGSSTNSFFRLFMVPGMFHCRGGVGTDTFDAATPLVKWVESGAAPEQIAASRIVQSKVVRTCIPRSPTTKGPAASTMRRTSVASILDWTNVGGGHVRLQHVAG
jgi:Tannase and feruloyl esterase